jgi:hypothetical protein
MMAIICVWDTKCRKIIDDGHPANWSLRDHYVVTFGPVGWYGTIIYFSLFSIFLFSVEQAIKYKRYKGNVGPVQHRK